MMFTPDELEELRRADAEIDENFRLTNEEIQASRKRDRESVVDRKDHRGKKIAAKQAAYREANKEKIAVQNARAAQGLPSVASVILPIFFLFAVVAVGVVVLA